MKILYLSTYNVSRSILAESITRKFQKNNIKAGSAGSHHRDDIEPVAYRVLKNQHYSSENLVSKSWDKFLNWEPDIVITLCNKILKEKCPAYVGKSVHVHWGLPDPALQAGNMEENFTKTFKILDQRIKKVLDIDITKLDKTELRAHLKGVIE
ncbi:MAG: arsenate reductase ArsC [Kordiimonadaceae bacterium]|jgi:arsenate reductase (thioredoxin)|nr:arsenate reductase ArsC [Kordiimonadaceae bacterium]MBT6031665.1 arsenate reductase ArsC [Kordiimonadaceae bacterium]